MRELPSTGLLHRQLDARSPTERFFKPEMINYAMEVGDGSIKTLALRGVKDNPPYLHDQRLLTLDDTVEFFNLVLGDKLTAQEKQDLVAFMRAL
jgi:cytochrome c peroxidase